MFRVSNLAASAFVAASALVSGMCGTASAGTASGTPFTVQVAVTAGCAISTSLGGSTIDFGSVASTAAAPSDIASSVGVTCTSGAGYSLRFTSLNAMTANTARFMKFGTNSIGYQIRQGTTVIGDDNLNSFGGTGNGAVQNTAINFHINSWTPGALGTYTDQVTLQVDF